MQEIFQGVFISFLLLLACLLLFLMRYIIIIVPCDLYVHIHMCTPITYTAQGKIDGRKSVSMSKDS